MNAEHEIAAVEGNSMTCTCGLTLTAENPWAVLMAGSRHAEAMSA